MNPTHDLVILGSGTTAFAGALKGVGMGARVLMVEQSHLGGTCVNWGCIPSKTLIHQAGNYFEARRNAAWGLNLSAGPPDCPTLMAGKNDTVKRLRREHYQQVLESHPDIHILRGHGRFLSPNELQVGAEVIVGDRFLIACGGIPRVLRIPGLTDVDYLTSYSALHLPCFPRSLLILGGGVIALEMGQMFARFGTEVTILERGHALLKEFDRRLTGTFAELLAAEGVRVVFGVETEQLLREGDQTVLIGRIGEEACRFRAERFMLAVGTAPATDDLGLDVAGVETDDAGFIVVDDETRTGVEGIWAAGDVTGHPLIAPAGAHEAEVAVTNMFDPDAHRRIDHRHTPMGVFVDPEFATVGLSPKDAHALGLKTVDTYLDLDQIAKAHVMGGRRGGILLCTEQRSGKILGVQLLAPRAADIIHEATLAVRFGLTAADLADTVHVYPTISDGLRLAALENLRQQAALSGKQVTT